MVAYVIPDSVLSQAICSERMPETARQSLCFGAARSGCRCPGNDVYMALPVFNGPVRTLSETAIAPHPESKFRPGCYPDSGPVCR